MKQILPLQRNLVSITLSTSIYSFAASLVGVFIPLILFKSGARLSIIAGFYVIYAIVKLLINYPVVRIIQRFGAHTGLASGFSAGAIQLGAILGYSSTNRVGFLVVAAAAMAFTNAFLWSSQHLHISRLMDDATKSSSMATIAIIKQIMGILAPIIGGIIGLTLGPQWLLAVALVVATTALIPLHSMGKLENGRPSEQHLQYNLSGAARGDLFANFCFNIDTAVGVLVWPIYLAVIIGTFKGIGIISAFAAAITVIVLWIAGYRGDRGRDRYVLREGVTVNSLTHIFRLFATSPLRVAVVGSVYRGSLAYFSNAWTSTYYHHAKQGGTSYIMSMEIACDAAYLMLWILFYVLAVSVSTHMLFWITFAIAAISSWGCLAISRQARLRDES